MQQRISRRRFLATTGLAGAGAVMSLRCDAAAPKAASAKPAKSKRPNFVIFMADDLGHGDLGCYGNDVIRTPNLDALAAGGVRLDDFYTASPMCSPSRAALLTGRLPIRTGVYDWIPHNDRYKKGTLGRGSFMHLPRDEKTIPMLLAEAGYQTALCGKWHLNGMFNLPDQPQPNDAGFGYWFATQFCPPHHNPAGFVRNGKPLPVQKGYACQIVADDASRWLTDERKSDAPFFLCVWYHEPHEQIMSPPKLVASYSQALEKITTHDELVTFLRGYNLEEIIEADSLAGRFRKVPLAKLKKTVQLYFANITNLDLATGKVLKTLDELKLADNTMVLFTSDNGPAPWNPSSRGRSFGSTANRRGRKRRLWDGGLCVPGIVRWPNRIKAKTTSDEPVSACDILPTMCAAAGVALPKTKLDGQSILPLLEGNPCKRTAPIHFHFHSVYGKAGISPQSMMRDGDWVMVATWDKPAKRMKARQDWTFLKSPARKKWFADLKSAKLTNVRLYNLKKDPAQLQDLASSEPVRYAKMKAQLETLFADVQADAPIWQSDGTLKR